MLDKSRIFTFQSCNEKRLKNWLRDWMVYSNLTSKKSLYNSKRTWFSFHFCKILHEILYRSLSIEPTNAPLSKMALKTLKIYIFEGYFGIITWTNRDLRELTVTLNELWSLWQCFYTSLESIQQIFTVFCSLLNAGTQRQSQWKHTRSGIILQQGFQTARGIKWIMQQRRSCSSLSAIWQQSARRLH